MQAHWGDLTTETVQSRGPLVMGVDPVLADIPATFVRSGRHGHEAMRDYVDLLLTTAAPHIGFVKFQSAFFEAFGSAGVSVLARSIALAKSLGLAVILDAKRGDIGSTAAAYAQAYLDPTSGSDLEVDALTVNPFLGDQTLLPFVECTQRFGKGLFVLVRTSNPDSSWLQAQSIGESSVSAHVAKYVDTLARRTIGKSGVSNVGAVVGATQSTSAADLRELMPSSIFLAPGLGAQGGAAAELNALRRPDGTGLLVPVSRGLTKVHDLNISKDDYAELLVSRISSFASELA